MTNQCRHFPHGERLLRMTCLFFQPFTESRCYAAYSNCWSNWWLIRLSTEPGDIGKKCPVEGFHEPCHHKNWETLALVTDRSNYKRQNLSSSFTQIVLCSRRQPGFHKACKEDRPYPPGTYLRQRQWPFKMVLAHVSEWWEKGVRILDQNSSLWLASLINTKRTCRPQI